MTPYPAMTQTDGAQQLFAQIMGGYKPGQLGGEPQPLEVKPVEAAQMPAGGDLSGGGGGYDYIQNSGGLGVLAQAFDAYAKRKEDERNGTGGGNRGGIVGGIIDLMKGGGLQ